MVFNALEDNIPEDEIYPDDLAKLGFFITEEDKIRYAQSPDQGPRYKINRNDRVNRAHIESLHKAIRTSIYHRLVGIGMDLIKPPGTQPHAPVFISSNIKRAPRVVVFFGEVSEDLGIFSYRDACDDGLSFGSVLGLANAVLGDNAQFSPTALVLANSGQNVWYNAGGFAMTAESFDARALPSLAARQRPLGRRNLVANNTSIKAHTEWIFEHVLKHNLSLEAKVDILGLCEGGDAAMMYLRDNWNIWGPRISCMTLIGPEETKSMDSDVDDLTNPQSFAFFRRFRTSAWVLSDAPIGSRVAGLERYGCNTYSCGEATKTTCLLTRGLSHIHSWMSIMHAYPTAKEAIEVLPGETSLTDEVSEKLYNGIPFPRHIESQPVEVHSRAVLGDLSTSIANVLLGLKQFSFSADTNESENHDNRMQNEEGTGLSDEGLHVDEKGVDDETSAQTVPSARGTSDVFGRNPQFDARELATIQENELLNP